ncbi:MAG: hypothetical protein KAT32_00715 [Candidatus Moranbacteria bacterium]|nr:hypothetical protein [Candidatus Moranbacteria bacterium]
MNEVLENSAILESHYYGKNGSAIKYQTRNICSDATAKILEEMAKILFPKEDVRIYVLPAKDGCHQDSFLIKFSKNPMAVTISGILLTALLAHLSPLTQSTIKVNNSQNELNELEMKLKKDLDKNDVRDADSKIEALIKNDEIKENTDRHFRQLQKDSEIIKEKFIAKSENEVIAEKTIERDDFKKYIELPKENVSKTFTAIHNLRIVSQINTHENKKLA